MLRAKEIAVVAGEAILKITAEDVDVTEKSDGSPLTRADIASHNTIQSGLESLEPKYPILSEEGDLENISGDSWNIYWCVDPLDGTKEFVKGLDEYTVNIALVERGVPILGVIDAPGLGAKYYAAKDLGAWKVEGDGRPRRISANKRQRPETAVVSRSHLSAETKDFLSELGITKIVQHGSSLKLCAVAEGTADIYPRHGPTCLWDTAAGTAIATEAGCCVVDVNGEPLSYDPAAGLKHSGFIVRSSTLCLTPSEGS